MLVQKTPKHPIDKSTREDALNRTSAQKTLTLLLAVLLLAALTSTAATAQVNRLPVPEQSATTHATPEFLANAKASAERMRARRANRSAAENKASNLLWALEENAALRSASLFRVTDGRIAVEIALSKAGADAMDTLAAAGLEVLSHRTLVDGSVRVAARAPLANLGGVLRRAGSHEWVRSILPVIGEKVHVGSVESEGVPVQMIDTLHARGIKGAGTSVCVISNGIGGIDDSRASGDLPPDLEICPLNDDQGAEGTAMLEIIHDVAPDAKLGFCPAFSDAGQVGLANAVTWLSEDAFGGEGCDIVVDDVGYLTEPYFQDGVISQAVDAVDANGTLYLTSAGNQRQDHYLGEFVDITPGTDLEFPLVDLHDFAASLGGAPDPLWRGVVASGGNFAATFMYWNEPMGQAAVDFDLYMFDEFGFLAGDPAGLFPIGAIGGAIQAGSEDPFEVAFVVNDSAPGPFDNILSFFVGVDRYAAAGIKQFELFFNGFFAMTPTFNVPRNSMFGHPEAKGAVTVAAMGAVANIDGTPNPDLDILEPFSSMGPGHIWFTKDGTPMPMERGKPDVTGVDGVSVTGNGGFPTTFFGTSASAPHVAAIAALGLGQNAGLTNTDLKALLDLSAKDVSPPGADIGSGRGLVDPVRFVELAEKVKTLPPGSLIMRDSFESGTDGWSAIK